MFCLDNDVLGSTVQYSSLLTCGLVIGETSNKLGYSDCDHLWARKKWP